ncbi:MAG: ATP-binding cassette domain-containing protein [Deltaproteobacteria bacterium]|nr:ATP-binding cassette domain-containing protein [Deltaproteobacteria bacterium]
MLEVKDLRYAVNNNGASQEIIPAMSYRFQKGRFYAITGPNGSGKTTLAKLIMGIYAATAGKIILDGVDITAKPVNERAQAGIAYSFQHPARFKGITFRELISIAANTDDATEILRLMKRVGICSLSHLDIPVDGKLSGGEIKKIELATTIARNPKVAIYDEPDTGIDLWTIEPMVKLIKNEQVNHGTTTIVVSHNKAFLEAADTVLILRGGQFFFDGTFAEALPHLNNISVCDYRTCGDKTYDECFR